MRQILFSNSQILLDGSLTSLLMRLCLVTLTGIICLGGFVKMKIVVHKILVLQCSIIQLHEWKIIVSDVAEQNQSVLVLARTGLLSGSVGGAGEGRVR